MACAGCRRVYTPRRWTQRPWACSTTTSKLRLYKQHRRLKRGTPTHAPFSRQAVAQNKGDRTSATKFLRLHLAFVVHPTIIRRRHYVAAHFLPVRPVCRDCRLFVSSLVAPCIWKMDSDWLVRAHRLRVLSGGSAGTMEGFFREAWCCVEGENPFASDFTCPDTRKAS